jgi:DNA repair exonuclease SbcCD ATPase subunit
MTRKFYFKNEGTYSTEDLEPLGAGRYGEVWKVQSENGQVRRAVKVNSSEYRDVLQKEFENLKALEDVDKDGLIARAYEIGDTEDQRPCMLMELVEGKPLRVLAQELRRRVVLSSAPAWSLEDETLRIRVATQITYALYTAFKARIALTDLKIDNFFYDESWSQLVKVIDWNFVDTENPRKGFVDDTLPKLGDVFYEIFTGLSLRDKNKEDHLGTINKDLFARKSPDQIWPMFWDYLTFGTQKLIHDMVFGVSAAGGNPPFDLWSRWLARRNLLVDKDGFDKVSAIGAADLAGKLDIDVPDWEVMDAHSILRLNEKKEEREERLRMITHHYIAGLVRERDFSQSRLSLLSARRLYEGSLRLDFWLLFTQLGLSAKPVAVYVNQIQDLPEKMEGHWTAGEFEQLRNMLERVLDKVKDYWPPQSRETVKIIEHLFVMVDLLCQVRAAEDALAQDSEDEENRHLPNFITLASKLIQTVQQNKQALLYLRDTAHLPPSYELVLKQFFQALKYIDDRKQSENIDLELDFYSFIVKSKWHNAFIVKLFQFKIEKAEAHRRASAFKDKRREVESNITKAQDDISSLYFDTVKTQLTFEGLKEEIEKISNLIEAIKSNKKAQKEKQLSEFDKLTKEIESIKEKQLGKLDMLTKEIESSKEEKLSELDRLTKEIESSKEEKLGEKEKQLGELDNLIKEVESDKEEKFNRLNQNFQEIRSKKNESSVNLKVLDNDLREVTKTQESLKGLFTNAKTELNKLENELPKVSSQSAQLSAKINPLLEKNVDIDGKFRELGDLQKAISSQSENIKNELVAAQEIYDVWAPQSGELLDNLKDLSSDAQKVIKQAKVVEEKKKEIDSSLQKIQDILQLQGQLVSAIENVKKQSKNIEEKSSDIDGQLESVGGFKGLKSKVEELTSLQQEISKYDKTLEIEIKKVKDEKGKATSSLQDLEDVKKLQDQLTDAIESSKRKSEDINKQLEKIGNSKELEFKLEQLSSLNQKIDAQSSELEVKIKSIESKMAEHQNLQDVHNLQKGLLVTIETIEAGFENIEEQLEDFGGYNGLESKLKKFESLNQNLANQASNLEINLKRLEDVDKKSSGRINSRKKLGTWQYLILILLFFILLALLVNIFFALNASGILSFGKKFVPTFTQIAVVGIAPTLTVTIASPTEAPPSPTSTDTPTATSTIVPTPEKIFVPFGRNSVSRTLPSATGLYAQSVNGPIENKSDEIAIVIGKNKNADWFLIQKTDSNASSWLGWIPKGDLKNFDDSQIENLPRAITCTPTSSESSVNELRRFDGDTRFPISKYVVYIAMAIHNDGTNEWVQLDARPGVGFIQSNLVQCSDDLSLLPVK